MTDTYIILAGQSNALGFGNSGAAPYTPTARVQIWADTNNDGVGDAWNYMSPGTNTGTPMNPTVWGPEVQFANAWLANHATGNLWIDKIAKGSTGLANDSHTGDAGLDWSPASTGEMYDIATASVHAAHDNLNGSSYAFGAWNGLLWMQGETDATDPTKAANYQTNLADFISHARTDWNVTPVVVGRITDSAALPDSLAVRQGEFGVDQADAHVTSFKTIGFEMQADGEHYDANGHVSLGEGFYDNWLLA
jgi:hypothetical protein